MKRIFILVAVCLLASVTALAGGINVTSGNKKVFKNAHGGVIFEVIFDGATYDDRMPLEEHFENLEDLKGVAWEGFRDNFEERCPGLLVTKEPENALFKITFTVTKMDQYTKVLGFIPAPATKAWGTVTITDLATGTVVTTVNVNAIDGGSNPSPDGTVQDCFEELGNQLAKLK